METTTYVVKVPVDGKPTLEPFVKNNSYGQLSAAVGGYIESVILPSIEHKGDYEITCYVNEEGLLKGLPINYLLTMLCRVSYGDPLCGNAIFVGTDKDGETVGFTEEDAKDILALLA